MALVKKQSNSTRTIIIAVVIIAVAGVGYLLFTQLYLRGGDDSSGNANGRVKSVISNFGEAILNDGRYNSLRSYGSNVSVDANANPGQPNPFQ